MFTNGFVECYRSENLHPQEVSKIRIHISYGHQEQDQEQEQEQEPIIDPRRVTVRGRVRPNYRGPGFTPLVEGDQNKPPRFFCEVDSKAFVHVRTGPLFFKVQMEFSVFGASFRRRLRPNVSHYISNLDCSQFCIDKVHSRHYAPCSSPLQGSLESSQRVPM